MHPLASPPRATFQSTLPARGATASRAQEPPASRFQSTLPARGATFVRVIKRENVLFQSTLPARGATRDFSRSTPCVLFQSTLPARGATLITSSMSITADDFNPRSLHGERRRPIRGHRTEMIFQSTLPARGATSAHPSVARPPECISIHAPCTGSDAASFFASCRNSYFNPRSLHGERRNPKWRNRLWSTFQSTLPARGATEVGSSTRTASSFQSTLPARGATSSGRAFFQRDRHFNPRSLHGERLYAPRKISLRANISIHAPCTGSDARYRGIP